MAHDHDVLPDSITELSAEVRVLRDAIDELREVLQWQTRNPQGPIQAVPIVQSMALNPGTADWAENLTLRTGTPAIVEQRLAARFRDEIRRLHELLAELSDCPELDPANDLAPVTEQVLAQVNAALNVPIELPESTTTREPEPPQEKKPRRGGQLF